MGIGVDPGETKELTVTLPEAAGSIPRRVPCGLVITPCGMKADRRDRFLRGSIRRLTPEDEH